MPLERFATTAIARVESAWCFYRPCKRIGLAMAAFALLVAAGCQSRGRFPDHPGVVHSADPRDVVARLSAESLLPTRPSLVRMAVARGSDEGKILSVTLKPTGANRWRWSFNGVRTVHLLKADTGAWLIEGVDEQQEDMAIRYDPPLTLIPARVDVVHALPRLIAAGKSRVTITTLKTGAPRDEGVVAYTVSLVRAPQAPDTGGDGPAAALTDIPDAAAQYVLRSTRATRLGFASSDVTTLAAYMPGDGLAQEHITRRKRILGLSGDAQVDEYVRLR